MVDFSALAAPFPRDQIDWKPGSVMKDGTKALAMAYVDVRTVRDRLDAVCGPANWQSRIVCYGGKHDRVICEIGLRVDGEWIWKADGAGDSQVEAEKGAISDAFKRTAVSWGVGRYLYDFDSVWVPWDAQKKRFSDDPWKFVRGSTTPPASAPKPAAPVAPSPDDKRAAAETFVTAYINSLRACKTASAFYELKNDKKKNDGLKRLEDAYPDLRKMVSREGTEAYNRLGLGEGAE